MDILSFENLNILIIVLLPGFITTNLIDMISPPKKYQEFVYVIKCIIYGLLTCFIISYLSFEDSKKYYALLIIVSILLGIIVGLIKQNKCVSNLLGLLNIQTSTPVPSAWDEIFSKQYTGFVIVILVDGTAIKGLIHNKSIIGDEIKDLYLEKLYYKKDDNEWYCDDINAGVYIAKDQISRIEFLKEVNNGQ